MTTLFSVMMYLRNPDNEIPLRTGEVIEALRKGGLDVEDGLGYLVISRPIPVPK